jgi:hypothetical protein
MDQRRPAENGWSNHNQKYAKLEEGTHMNVSNELSGVTNRQEQ